MRRGESPNMKPRRMESPNRSNSPQRGDNSIKKRGHSPMKSPLPDLSFSPNASMRRTWKINEDIPIEDDDYDEID